MVTSSLASSSARAAARRFPDRTREAVDEVLGRAAGGPGAEAAP